MTNDIFRLTDALVRDNDGIQIRKFLKYNSDIIINALNRTGEYRIKTTKGNILIKYENNIS